MKFFVMYAFIAVLVKTSYSSVSKEKLSEITQAKIVTIFHSQLKSRKSPRNSSIDEEATKEIQQEAKKWGDVIHLLPQDTVEDNAASWIANSIARRATFFGPYFLTDNASELSGNSSYKQKHEISVGYLKGISQVFPTLTSAQLLKMLNQRRHLLDQINDYHKRWRSMIIGFLDKRNTLSISKNSGALGRSAKSLLQMAADPNEFKNHNGAIIFTDNSEASISLTAALAFNTQQFLQISYVAVYSSIDTIFSLVYYPKLVPSFDGYRSFNDAESELKTLLSSCLYTRDEKEVLDISRLQDVLWKGEHLQFKFRSNSGSTQIHDHNASDVPYTLFTNDHAIWKNLSDLKWELYDPMKFDNTLKPTLSIHRIPEDRQSNYNDENLN